MQPLTYSAYLRQLPFKNAWLHILRASTTPHILPIRQWKNHGILHKEIAIIGTVRVVGWVGQNPSMGEWSMDVVYWLTTFRFTSSQSHVEEGKFRIHTRRKTMENGRTGFWMRVDAKLNVRVVNGTMYKLLNAKKGCILTHILSRHMHRQLLRARLYASRKNRRAENTGRSYPKTYGLIGLKARSKSRGWVSNTTLLVSKAQRVHQGMSQNTYLNPPFSRLIGLKDGSASATVKAFQMRQNVRQQP